MHTHGVVPHARVLKSHGQVPQSVVQLGGHRALHLPDVELGLCISFDRVHWCVQTQAFSPTTLAGVVHIMVGQVNEQWCAVLWMLLNYFHCP